MGSGFGMTGFFLGLPLGAGTLTTNAGGGGIADCFALAAAARAGRTLIALGSGGGFEVVAFGVDLAGRKLMA